jgi:hypothetical protein
MIPGKKWQLLTLGLIPLAWLGAALGRRAGTADGPPVSLDSWDVPRLIAHLNGRGLGLRPVAASAGGDCTRSAFLTRTGQGFEQLNSLSKSPEWVEHWRGTAYCERLGDLRLQDMRILVWGDCCLVAPPFVFFGDRELLAEIRDILYGAESSRGGG